MVSWAGVTQAGFWTSGKIVSTGLACEYRENPLGIDTLRPTLTWAKGYYDSNHGRIVSNWKREGDKLSMDVTIPGNTTATVYVPAKDAAVVTESGKPAAKSDGVKFLRMENNAAVYAVGSGIYQFQSTMSEIVK